MNDVELLQIFAEQNSEAAFRALVERHLPLVLGTARRVTGDNALAEDIAQTVFILLARKAKRLGRGTILAGWLYRTTRFVTARALTAEQRRRRREQEAVTMQSSTSSDPSWLRLGPELDKALARLGDTDRNAILLRYFEQQSLREVGRALGLNEEAAKKRVARALEKLRRTLNRRGAEISAVALAAGLTKETAEAAGVLPLAGKISAVAIAHGTAGAGAAGSALLTDVLGALRWAKIQSAVMAVLALIAVSFVLPAAVHYWPRPAISSAPARAPELKKTANPSAAKLGNAVGAFRTLTVTVLDAKTGNPIRGAVLSPGINGPLVQEFQNPFRTGPDGTAKMPIPNHAPGGERTDYFEVSVEAPGYVERIASWSCATGMVLNVVPSQHTVQLSRGVTLSGLAVDETGNPLAGLRVGALCMHTGGSRTMAPDSHGRLVATPVVIQDDHSSYWLPVEASPVVTDAEGRFKLEHYPADVRNLTLDLLGPDGARHQFQTPDIFHPGTEASPNVSLSELKNGAARLVIPQGVTVDGIVVDYAGTPIPEAKVIEATEWGSLQVLSQNKTDASGHFCLSNRPQHQVILGVSAEGSASVSAIVSIQQGMVPVRLQLPPELPLRGRVVDENGMPLPNAAVSSPDYLNPGQCLTWSDETDANGQFSWPGAPTNEVALVVSASGYASHIVRLRASTNESEITLRGGTNENVRITGHVTDADSGAPLDHFQVKVSRQMMTGGIPMGPTQNFDGSNGEMNIQLLLKDFHFGGWPAWIMTVEAAGYDAGVSRAYYLEEGNQQLDFKLKRGGVVEGMVRTPAGEPAAGAQLALTVLGQGTIPCFRQAQLPRNMSTNRCDASGQFELKKPPLPHSLVIFHDSGWAVVPITAGVQKADITLSPWARIEGNVTIGNGPAPSKTIELNNLTWDYSDALAIFYRGTTDDDGHFVFDKVPAGNFKLTCSAVESGRWSVSTLQTFVTVAAGETTSVNMAASGGAVSAHLLAPPGFAAINWSNALATLSADVQVPPEPARNGFVSDEALEAAHLRYAHDPSVLAALEKQKTFAGSVSPDGTAVFQQVPPGNYILEVKLYDPSKIPPPPNLDNEPAVVLARLRAMVTVPEAAEPSGNAAPVALGDYTLDSL